MLYIAAIPGAPRFPAAMVMFGKPGVSSAPCRVDPSFVSWRRRVGAGAVNSPVEYIHALGELRNAKLVGVG